MSQQRYLNVTNNNLIDTANVNITDSVSCTPFVGIVGNGLTVDTQGTQVVAFTNGEGDVECDGTGTRTVFKLGTALALVKAP